MQTTPVYSTTVAPSVSPPYTRTSMALNFAYPSTSPGFTLIPINLECIITPKATMAAMYFDELANTNTP